MDAASPDATLGRYRAPETPPARPRDRGGTIARGSVGEVRPEADMRTWEPGNVPDVHIRHVRTSVPASVHRGGYGDIRGIGDMRPQAPT